MQTASAPTRTRMHRISTVTKNRVDVSNKLAHRYARGRHDGSVVTEVELRASVDAVFEVTGIGMVPWPAPHPDRSPLDVEYSRVTDGRKWRIIGARADAWVIALVEAGVANVDRRTEVEWRAPPGTVISRTDRVMPRAAGALPLVVARSQLATIPDAGITLGAGDPAVCVAWFPHCGCDACDSGSGDALDDLDAHVFAVVSGAFRRLSLGRSAITVIGDGGWSASNLPRGADVARILADPTGWDEVAGGSWLRPD